MAAVAVLFVIVLLGVGAAVGLGLWLADRKERKSMR